MLSQVFGIGLGAEITAGEIMQIANKAIDLHVDVTPESQRNAAIEHSLTIGVASSLMEFANGLHGSDESRRSAIMASAYDHAKISQAAAIHWLS